MSTTGTLDGLPGIVTVDLKQVVANWKALAAHASAAECAAVVKADAYGLGVAHVVPALATAGCATFFVATTEEAAEVRDLAPEAVIYVLDGLIGGAGPRLAEIGARPALASLDDCLEWAALCEARDRVMAAAIHLDTGLNRLGLSSEEVTRLAADASLFNRIGVELVMSHLACADTPGHPKNAEQLLVFEQLRAALPPARASLAASDGLMLGPEYHFDLVRPGYALYGGQPTKGITAPVKPAVRVQARVLQVRDVPTGDAVGYGATWRAPSPTRIATIAAGYADGVARASSAASGAQGGHAAFHGKLVPIVGRISMDLVTLDITALAEDGPQRGDFVDLIGPGLTYEAAGAAAGTIGYEVLTRLTKRYHRRYV